MEICQIYNFKYTYVIFRLCHSVPSPPSPISLKFNKATQMQNDEFLIYANGILIVKKQTQLVQEDKIKKLNVFF